MLEDQFLWQFDGTQVSNEDAVRYQGRKGYPTQNALATCSFDLKFSPTYYQVGKKLLLDLRIIKNALTRNDNLKISQGNFNSNIY